MSELAVIVAALIGSGGLVGLLLKRWWKQQDNATDAFRAGAAEGEKRCAAEVAALRAQIGDDRERCEQELAKLREALAVIVKHPTTDAAVRAQVFAVLWPSVPPPGQAGIG